MPTGKWVREGQCGGWEEPARGAAHSTEKYQPSIHRGKEHGTPRRCIASGEEARSRRGDQTLPTRVAAGLGLGEGHSSVEAG
jgi:hypothetical protein